MITGDASTASRPPRPFQFTLRQLLSLAGVVCLLSAAYYWLGTSLPGVLLGLACIGVIPFALVYFFAGKSSPLLEVLFVVAVFLLLIALLLPAVGGGPPHGRMACSNHLKQIGIALQNYHDVYGSFPPAYVADANGRPMHSWRVLILPFAEHKA